jgi:hypothetical protein
LRVDKKENPNYRAKDSMEKHFRDIINR